MVSIRRYVNIGVKSWFAGNYPKCLLLHQYDEHLPVYIPEAETDSSNILAVAISEK